MDVAVREPFQGVRNIIRFNWHFYVLASGAALIFFSNSLFLNLSPVYSIVSVIVGFAILIPIVLSLLVSYVLYDRSNLYSFLWMKDLSEKRPTRVVNLHAGFDETSSIIVHHFPEANFSAFDFYDAKRHTEVSIKRARKVYDPFPGTVSLGTNSLPLGKGSVDILFNIFALHEIREREERIAFLQEQTRAMKKDGICVVMEHLRDVPNFLAYTFGAFHFHAKKEWKMNFLAADLQLERTLSVTPFVTVFVLKKRNGSTP